MVSDDDFAPTRVDLGGANAKVRKQIRIFKKFIAAHANCLHTGRLVLFVISADVLLLPNRLDFFA